MTICLTFDVNESLQGAIADSMNGEPTRKNIEQFFIQEIEWASFEVLNMHSKEAKRAERARRG